MPSRLIYVTGLERLSGDCVNACPLNQTVYQKAEEELSCLQSEVVR